MTDLAPSERTASGPTTSAPTALTLASRLERVRQRYHMEALAAIVLALVPLAIALAWTRDWAMLGDLSRPSGLLAWSGIILILAIGALLLWRAPGIDDVARHADAQLGTAERLSSARPMLGDAPSNLGPLGPALLDDAARHSEGLVRMRIAAPGAALGALAAVSVVLGAAVVLWAQAPSPRHSEANATHAAEGQVVETLPDEQVEQLRELIEADAKRLNNPYLEAVANSLEQFQRDAPDMAPEERAEHLAGLLDHAASAYGSSRPGWLPRDTTNMAALSANLERQAISAALAANSAAAGSVPLPDEWDPNAADPALRSAAALQDLLAGAGASAGPLVMDELGQPVATPPQSSPFAPRPLDPGKLNAATPAGASLNADEGASATAGIGRQPLEGEQTQTANAGFDTQMTLSSEAPGEGNLIRIEVAPEPRFTEVDGAAVQAVSLEDRPLLPVFQTPVSAASRPLVARYFTDDPAAFTSGR